MPEDDEDSEDEGDYEGSGAGESPIVGGHVNSPRKPDGSHRPGSTKKPKNGGSSILSTADYGGPDDDDDIDDDGDDGDGDDDFDGEFRIIFFS